MIEKQCQFAGQDEHGVHVSLLYSGYDNDHLVKTAQISAPILDDIKKFVKATPRSDAKTLVLVSALGAGEYWGSNTNGDLFPEDALIHTPPGWNELPLGARQKVGATWEWGYPTFYNARPYLHHQNKDPERAFGDVVYSTWDPHMRRVLLVVAIDHDKAQKTGAVSVLDKINNGRFPDVSMGTRVPFDNCSVCSDWGRILPLLNKPVEILRSHKRDKIRGLSETKNDYCSHLRFELNKIYPNGKKVCMYNFHPRFFDISFVFIGADKTSKVMAKLAAGMCPIRDHSKICKHGCLHCSPDLAVLSSHVHDVWDREKVATRQEETVSSESIIKKSAADYYVDPKEEKAAKQYFDKKRKLSSVLNKRAEIVKQIRSNFSRALPAMEEREPNIPAETLNSMGKDTPGALRTAGSLGIVLKPQEFQRVFLSSVGRPEVADEMDQRGMCFRVGEQPTGASMLGPRIIPSLLSALAPMLSARSCFGPPLHKRIIQITIAIRQRPETETMDDPLMSKMGSAYSDYRRELLYKFAQVTKGAEDNFGLINQLYPEDLEKAFTGLGIAKAGSSMMESLIGMLPAMYLNRAYMNEPVSAYVEDHLDFAGIKTAGELAVVSGGVA